jgi:hypothetical protein
MGVALGWVSLLVAVAAPTELDRAQISYTVRMVEASGLGWRGALSTHLKHVTRQGAATIWTLPKSASKSLIESLAANRSGPVVQGPRVTAVSGDPVGMQDRAIRRLMTRVAWDSGHPAATAHPEDIGIGWRTTMVGRKLDKGILVKMVFEDTEIRAVHKVKFSAHDPDGAKNARYQVSENCQGIGKIAEAHADALEGSQFDPTAGMTEDAMRSRIKKLVDSTKIGYGDGEYTLYEAMEREALVVNPFERTAAMPSFKVRLDRRFPAGGAFGNCYRVGDHDLLEFPEIAREEILGEWLIPKDECLLVSFGPHIASDVDGKPIVRERLAIVEADTDG